MKKLKKYFFSKLTKLHKRNSDRPQMYNLKGITSDGKVVDFRIFLLIKVELSI